MNGQNLKNILVINSEYMGEEQTIGANLMQAAIHTLCDIDSIPSKIIFYNSGVKLFEKNESIYNDLKYLESVGVEFYLCKTCVDYFNVENHLGKVTNMFEILSLINGDDKVIYL